MNTTLKSRRVRPPTNPLQEGRARKGYDYGDYPGEVRRRGPDLWRTAARFATGQGPPPKRPYQVEAHLCQEGRAHCRLRCVDCLGQCLYRRSGLLADTWVQLIADLKDVGVPSVVYSGIYSDPVCVDEDLLIELLDNGGPAWGVKLHSSALQLSEPVGRALIRAAQADPRRESYVCVSKVTMNPEVMETMCQPAGMSGVQALQQQEENLDRLFSLAQAAGFPLKITLNCRMTRINAHPRDLADLLSWLNRTPEQVSMRLTTDYLPTAAGTGLKRRFYSDIYLPPREARQRLALAMELAEFWQTKRITFRAVASQVQHDLKICLNRLLFAAVSTSGKVFPCQGIASEAFRHLAYGDLQVRRFPEIWADFTASLRQENSDPIASGCPRCAAECERQICRAMAEETCRRRKKCPEAT